MIPELGIDRLKTENVYSPDKRYLAYFESGQPHLYIYDFQKKSKITLANLGNPTPVSDNVSAKALSWSPDGTGLVVSTSTGLYLVSPDGELKLSIAESGANQIMGWTN